jgi:hypothetical protein
MNLFTCRISIWSLPVHVQYKRAYGHTWLAICLMFMGASHLSNTTFIEMGVTNTLVSSTVCILEAGWSPADSSFWPCVLQLD